MNPRVWILLPVHNRKSTTEKFINSLLAQSYQNYHLILIDDGSTDGTSDMVADNVPSDRLTIIYGNGNLWWAGSLQKGIDWLSEQDVQMSDVILMINDDVEFPPCYIENGIHFMRMNPDSLLLSRYYNPDTGEITESGVRADLKRMMFVTANTPDQINCLSTRGLFMLWRVCRSIGGFYTIFLPHYGSDYEYTIRAKRKGYNLCTVPNVYIVPDHNETGFRSASDISNIRMLLSKKCALNPIYRSIFVLLISPIPWIPLNLLKVWLGAFRVVLKIFNKRTKK